MDNFQANVLAAVQDGLADVRAGGMAVSWDRFTQNFGDVASFITANGMAFLALATVGLVVTILVMMAYKAINERRIEFKLAEEAAGKLQNEVFDLQDKLTSYARWMKEMGEIITQRNHTISDLREEIREKDEQIFHLGQQNDRLNDEIYDLGEEVERQSTDIVELAQANSRLKSRNADLEAEIENYQDTIADLETDLESAESDRDFWEEECHDARIERNDLEEERDAAHEENARLETLLDLHKDLAAANEAVYAEAA